jgi:hypothetical protein
VHRRELVDELGTLDRARPDDDARRAGGEQLGHPRARGRPDRGPEREEAVEGRLAERPARDVEQAGVGQLGQHERVVSDADGREPRAAATSDDAVGEVVDAKAGRVRVRDPAAGHAASKVSPLDREPLRRPGP